ncbi:NAD-dependent epimerase/dehydratase family protein [Christiangramia sabulilitoris]|uniref:NAD-dependent epimerase/dehydratase family protein n=1 Tax=Christiangramia sabulilitoris TaxID=2583991 RepID=A0A550I3G7_9FLAO|nr:NAD-dependent epimerase/dehydratase family protein [Christiangramia sabulilitoris]TRO65527.1 NAD-dependent epimerase/dehydratase family protein [Christiangramia sabulilitoris]
MVEINKNKPVLVTGATGYVAGWLVKKLLEEGFTVHAAVRNPNNKDKVHHLDGIAGNTSGNIKYFQSDLLDDGSYAEAMEGCELVFHTASPFTSEFDDPQKELIEPAVKGTANVLNQANKTESVKRIVLTSSCAAIYSDATDVQKTANGSLTEEDWNTTSSLDYQPYSFSKTLAEKKAWEIHKKQSRWELVTINPSLVMGPPLNPKATTSESFSLLKQLGDGTFKMGAPKLGIGLVDVRDVADAHYKAGFTPKAHGRYITSAHNTNFVELGHALQPKYGDSYPVPTKALPKWILMLIGPYVNKNLTRRFIKNNVNVKWKADNSKIKNDLDIKFRPLRETMEDSFQVLIDNGII